MAAGTAYFLYRKQQSDRRSQSETDRRERNARRTIDRRRIDVRRVFDVFDEMLEAVINDRNIDRGRIIGSRLHLAVDTMTMGLPLADRRALWEWAMNISEGYTALMDWHAPDPKGRLFSDRTRHMITLGSEQILQWHRGEATAAEMKLIGDPAEERFMRNW